MAAALLALQQYALTPETGLNCKPLGMGQAHSAFVSGSGSAADSISAPAAPRADQGTGGEERFVYSAIGTAAEARERAYLALGMVNDKRPTGAEMAC